ncbi:hypothetical protein N7470_004630 [Penicillium chermesinum]|nr:hypothetical protein N7470_004630 [Penicillium chermesinum]
MDEYLETLSGNRELVYDELFCHQVRLQRIAAEVENMSGTDVPSTFYVAALRRKMNEIKAGVSPSLLQNHLLHGLHQQTLTDKNLKKHS